MISLIARHSRAVLKLWLSAIALQLFYFQYFRNNGSKFILPRRHAENFASSRKLSGKLVQNSPSASSFGLNSQTMFPQHFISTKSLISFFDIRSAGQFSRFSIQTKTRNGKLKHIGGDSWRVLLLGPATVSPTMFDHGNGTCDGYREPPKNWFIVGTYNYLFLRNERW